MPEINDLPILALDLETGGLTPGEHTPLSIGAVWLDGPRLPIDETNSFYAQLEWPVYVTTPQAMATNKLDLINPPGPSGAFIDRSYPSEEALIRFKQWLRDHIENPRDGMIYTLGFNVGSFDLPMLRSIWCGPWPFHYRSIDLNSLLFILSRIQNKSFDVIKKEIVDIAWDNLKKQHPEFVNSIGEPMEHHALADAWSNIYVYDECINRLNARNNL